MGFAYSILLKLLYPTSISIMLLLLSARLSRRAASRQAEQRGASSEQPEPSEIGDRRWKLGGGRWEMGAARWSFWLALAVLFICGNGWLVGTLTRHLERQYPPLQDLQTLAAQPLSSQGSDPVPQADSQPSALNPQPVATGSKLQAPGSRLAGTADAILILSGGIYDSTPPRPTVEIGEAGDRLLYGAYLYRQGRATNIICTGNVATGGIARRALAEQMADFLKLIGIPTNAVLTEIKSENTHQHAVQLAPVFQERGFRRILLVTSAMHMPRSMAVFRKQCPNVEFIPAPTDFQSVERAPMPWYRHLTALIPTPSNLLAFNNVAHEYLGLVYYKIRGWT